MTDHKLNQTKSKKNFKFLLNIFLFLTTIITVFIAGSGFLLTNQPDLQYGLQFMAGLMSILVAHETGHYVMARKNKVNASLPFFIPLPPGITMIGTMGAVIIMRGRIKSRNALMEVGAAGPLAGMAVAVPLLFIGLIDCPIMYLPDGGFVEGQSLLYIFAKWIMIENIPPDYDINLSGAPLVWAAWVGMLVTMLNMFPIGQLDGGHVFYALFGDIHTKVSKIFHKLLFVIGVVIITIKANEAMVLGYEADNTWLNIMPGMSWLFLGGFMALLFRKKGFVHPHTDDNTLSPKHKAMGILCLLIFVLTFMPVIMTPII